MTDKTDIELMQQSLEVLVQHVEHYDYEQFTSMCELEPAKDLILALRERLAQQEQEQLEWQGAFFDAVYEAWHSTGMDVLGGDWNTFASTLEAKLKEKNT